MFLKSITKSKLLFILYHTSLSLNFRLLAHKKVFTSCFKSCKITPKRLVKINCSVQTLWKRKINREQNCWRIVALLTFLNQLEGRFLSRKFVCFFIIYTILQPVEMVINKLKISFYLFTNVFSKTSFRRKNLNKIE